MCVAENFSRLDNMKRHMKYVHSVRGGGPSDGDGGGVGGGWGGGGRGRGGRCRSGGQIQFLHPFTMTLSGPTSCGKTTQMLKMLQNNVSLFDPPPERIVYMYRRWQPMYDEMQSTVTPPIEFVKGIPMDVEQDHYLDSTIPNLIIMDDLMSVTSKDKRINEMFTTDSHHRNCSVITINQNLYYSKDPTQRRNCHYLILFNNPVDKLCIMTLGRQMYPNNSKYFVRHFEEAVSKPYGYLLVDLKSTTPEHLRLRGNALNESESIRRSNQMTKERNNSSQIDYTARVQSEPSKPPVSSPPAETSYTVRGSTDQTQSELSSDFDGRRLLSPCQHCGVVYFTDEDLNKHIEDKHRTMRPCVYCGLAFSTNLT